MTTQDTGFLRLMIAEKEKTMRDIWRFELTDPRGASLPPFEAGSNLTVVMPNGMRRSYSLCNDSQENHRYVIAVRRGSNGCSGSMNLIDDTSTGDLIDISLPRNKFPLDERAKSFILVTGGIGITSMLSMACQLKAERLRDFKLYCLVRDPEGTAFLDEPSSDQWRSRVKVHHGPGDLTKPFDFWALFERSKVVHIYYYGL